MHEITVLLPNLHISTSGVRAPKFKFRHDDKNGYDPTLQLVCGSTTARLAFCTLSLKSLRSRFKGLLFPDET
ncbi:hypothetical protein RRG08_056100 [Elysia crispata]|uniref:Uncharacterized protein n=1 Tax=Elysia crispata TaxID=231223 RepID=A0AAE1DDE5_9GAST|nr:hypothetical protein RRG08_056100 [Elysia crispata]